MIGFIMVIILISTLRLILDTFVDSYAAQFIFDILDIIFTFIFIGEMMFKMIARKNDLIIGRDNDYTRDSLTGRIIYIITAVPS